MRRDEPAEVYIIAGLFLAIGICVAVGTVAAPGAAAGSALEMVHGGEDEVRPLEVVVLGLKTWRGLRCGVRGTLDHDPIFAEAALCPAPAAETSR